MRKPGGPEWTVEGRGSGPASTQALKIIFAALRGAHRRRPRSRELERWEKLGRLAAEVRVNLAWEYLEARRKARRGETTTEEVLRENLAKTVNLERILEAPELTVAERRWHIADMAMQIVEVAEEAIRKTGSRDPTKRELRTALGLPRRSPNRPRFGLGAGNGHANGVK